MASPFKTFRKNQKAWMVPITLLSMVAFIFLGAWSRLGSSASDVKNPEVFTWKYGTVHQSDIRERLMNQQILARFLVQAAEKAGQDPFRAQQLVQQVMPMTEQAVVTNMLLEKEAQQLGIVISDAAVNNFLRSWTYDRVSSDELADLIHGLSSESMRVSQAQVFDALRTELAALKVRQAFSPLLTRSQAVGPGQAVAWFAGDTPADRWNYFCRLNRKVTAELLPVAVKDFVAQIPDPNDDELRRFYDQYKNNFPEPTLPTPGFKRPFKAKFEYVKADNDKFLNAELPKITDEEIKDYYEKNKQDFTKMSLPDLPEKSGDKGEPSDKPSGATDDGGKQGSENNAEKSTDMKTGEGKAANDKAGDKKSDDSKSKDSKASDAKAGAAKAGETKGNNTKAGGTKSDKKSDDAKKSSFAPHGSLDGEILAFADEAVLAQAKTDSTPKTDAKKSDTAKAEPSKPQADVGAKDAVKGAADAKSSDGKPSDAPPDKSGADTETPATGADTQTPAAKRPIEYEPLEKVAEQIKRQLAQQKVAEKIKPGFVKVQSELDRYRRSLENYRVSIANGNTSAKQPEPPKIAAPDDLELKETEMISDRQAYDNTDLGRSHGVIMQGEYNTPSFIQLAYNPALKPYDVHESVDSDNNHYLWWKVADEPIRVPPLFEIKPIVVEAWKMIQARTPAKAKAEKDAALARSNKETLKAAFGAEAGAQVSTPKPFTWLVRPDGNPFATPQLSKVDDVDMAGDDFMKSVFALQVDETGVAVNQPQTIYYVVQIEAEEPSTDTLREQFMAQMGSDITSQAYAKVGAIDNIRLNMSWLKSLEDQFGFQVATGHALAADRSNSDED